MSFNISKINIAADDLEQLGSKEKFWFLRPPDYKRWLFKYSRDNTGEHWSEKAAEQLCELLDIPHVLYELAEANGRIGVISPNIVPQSCRMVMGNEVLHNHSPKDYPIPELKTQKFVRVKEHTISRVLGCLDRSQVLPPITNLNIGELNSGDIFCGYLMLDALISNQDRHHENWAIIIDNNKKQHYLCPTYDHAASLGRELGDIERNERMNTKDKNRKISEFVKKARSELFKLKNDSKPLSTIDAFFNAVEKREKAKDHWLSRLENLKNKDIEYIFHSIPNEMISETARNFAFSMVLENKKRLQEYGRS